MSSQQGILNAFSSNKLWTAPSKDQYLPAYFKRVCDEYMKCETAHRVFPVEVSTSNIKGNLKYLIDYFIFQITKLMVKLSL